MREVKVFILKAVDRASASPMPETTLKAAVKLAFPHLQLTDAEVLSAIHGVEASGWISGMNDELLGTVWTLTTAGRLRVNQL